MFSQFGCQGTRLFSIERDDGPKLHGMLKAGSANTRQRQVPVNFLAEFVPCILFININSRHHCSDRKQMRDEHNTFLDVLFVLIVLEKFHEIRTN